MGLKCLNNAGSVASTGGMFEFGRQPDEVWLESGPHVLAVEVTAGDMTFSDQKVLWLSSTEPLGTIDG
jgi:hypothetical protein